MTMQRPGLLDTSPHEQAISLVYINVDLVATSMHLRPYNTILIIIIIDIVVIFKL